VTLGGKHKLFIFPSAETRVDEGGWGVMEHYPVRGVLDVVKTLTTSIV